MSRIYLVRHAQPEPGDEDPSLWPLSEQGEAQVRSLAAAPFWNEVKAIIASDELKAITTVSQIAFDRKIPLHKHPGLRELRRTPEWVDDYEARVLEVFQKPALSIGGWERASDAQARMMRTIDELLHRFDPEPFAVASHAMVLSLLLASLNNNMSQVFEIWQQFNFADVVLMES